MDVISTNVYDILFPSPPPLKDIVAISIALQLWRQEINTHRTKNTLPKLSFRRNILSSNSIPRIPATTMSMIEKYVKRVGRSINLWYLDHGSTECRDVQIFKNFNDLVADFDGSIHYVRTAKRLVQCNQVDPIVRFRFACSYCFEEDVLRIWPLVASHDELKLTKELFHKFPGRYYWICRSKNQLYKLPRLFTLGQSIEEEIFCKTHTCNHGYRGSFYTAWSFVDYFWNLLDSDTRIRVITNRKVYFHRPYRYLLSKFNEVELGKFVNAKGYQIIFDLLFSYVPGSLHIPQTCDLHYLQDSFNFLDRDPYTIAFWTYIKEVMNENNFFLLVQNIIQQLHRTPDPIRAPICCKLWLTAPDHLKAHVIRELFLDDSLLQRGAVTRRSDIDGLFLLTVLADASAEDKISFWNKHWRSLIDMMRTKQLDQLIRLCFSDDENEIVEFKLNSLSVLDNIRETCSRLLNNLSTKRLNNFLQFCCPDEHARKNMRLNLLVGEFKLSVVNIPKISSKLSDFINDAYDDANLAADFKNQLLFSATTMETFSKLIDSFSYRNNFNQEVLFIDILAPSEQVARDLKKFYVLPLLKQKLIAGNYLPQCEENGFSNFLRECTITGDDETAELKKTLSIDEIVHYVIQSASLRSGGPKYNHFLVEFLEWYFVTTPALEEFRARYFNDDVFTLLTTKID